jgi:hypothetical protein
MHSQNPRNNGYRPNPVAHFSLDNDDSQIEPTRDRNDRPTTGRAKINIDENEDTFSNQHEFSSILQRGRKLQEQMEATLGEDPWT